MKTPRTLRYLLLCSTLLSAPFGPTATFGREIPVDAEVNAELDYLLGFVGTGRQNPASIRIDRIGKTLEFLAGSKENGALYYANQRNGAPSAYLQLDLRRSMSDVLRLTYDTDLPAAVTSPSTVRAARWSRIQSPDGRLPKFWEMLNDLRVPTAMTGVEYLVNSPDAHTGTYYEYNVDRSLILLSWKSRPLFISLSAQKGTSAVGKQGIILGPDDHWTYLYSGLPGLNWPGFGWVDSYLYDSYSVAFFLGLPSGKAPTRFGIFKWIRAGWVGMNMAQKSHIANGLRRYGEAFKDILESPATADVTAVIRQFAKIRELPEKQLEKLTETYLGAVRTGLHASPVPQGAKEAAALLSKGSYLRSLGRDDKVSIASLEGLKALLGKPHYLKPPVWAMINASRD